MSSWHGWLRDNFQCFLQSHGVHPANVSRAIFKWLFCSSVRRGHFPFSSHGRAPGAVHDPGVPESCTLGWGPGSVTHAQYQQLLQHHHCVPRNGLEALKVLHLKRITREKYIKCAKSHVSLRGSFVSTGNKFCAHGCSPAVLLVVSSFYRSFPSLPHTLLGICFHS